jgi:hypothetical protein
MENVSKKQTSDKQDKESVFSSDEFTAKGNKIYKFTSVSKEEIERLRVPTYEYLL